MTQNRVVYKNSKLLLICAMVSLPVHIVICYVFFKDAIVAAMIFGVLASAFFVSVAILHRRYFVLITDVGIFVRKPFYRGWFLWKHRPSIVVHSSKLTMFGAKYVSINDGHGHPIQIDCYSDIETQIKKHSSLKYIDEYIPS